MELISVMGNSQKLDGGAMFGNAPKAMWEKWAEVDDLNRIQLATRGLIVRHAGATVLFETGIGAYMEPKFKERYGVVESEHVLLNSLNQVGIRPEDITHVVLSHLHFDHTGGALASYQAGAPLKLLFPNAKWLIGEEAFQRSLNPHPRDKASFIPGLANLFYDSGKLCLIHDESSTHPLSSWVQFTFSHGHTPGLMLSWIQTQGILENKKILFASDLIPGAAWVHLPITMGYDRFPELVIDEKKKVLEQLVQRGDFIYFTHDLKQAMAKVNVNEKGIYSTYAGLEKLHLR